MSRRYKKGNSRKISSIIIAVLMIVTNLLTPMSILAESGGNIFIESEVEIDEELVESTEQVLDVEDTIEDIYGEISYIQEDDYVEESLDVSPEENKQKQEPDITKEQEGGSSKEEKTDKLVEESADEWTDGAKRFLISA